MFTSFIENSAMLFDFEFLRNFIVGKIDIVFDLVFWPQVLTRLFCIGPEAWPSTEIQDHLHEVHTTITAHVRKRNKL